jgi:hypothetical protein
MTPVTNGGKNFDNRVFNGDRPLIRRYNKCLIDNIFAFGKWYPVFHMVYLSTGLQRAMK